MNLNTMSEVLTALLPIQSEFHFYLPNRNFLLFDGKPMYRIMIETLLSIERLERIIINTDSEEVKEYCKWNGRLAVIDRPESLKGEDITSDMITAYDLEKISGEHFLQVQSFNPLVKKASIETAIAMYYDFIVHAEEKYYDSVFSMQRRELRNYDLDKRVLKDDYQFVIFEDRILNVFSRTDFRKQGNRKVGKMAMMYDIREIENTIVDSEASYELVKLVHANQSKFPAVFNY